MGNYMKSCRVNNTRLERGGESEKKIEETQGKKAGKDDEGKFVKEVVNSRNGIRVKMVLTKEELQWLMLQLRNKENGGINIEDVLGEIEKGRIKKVGGHYWRPSLQSISEVLEMNS